MDKSARSKRGRWKMRERKYRHDVARVDNAGVDKSVCQGLTLREWKYQHHAVGVDNAGVDLSARYCKDGQCGK